MNQNNQQTINQADQTIEIPITITLGDQLQEPIKEKKTVKPKPAQKIIEKKELNDEDTQALIPQDYYLSSPLFNEVANYFGLEYNDFDQAKDQLSLIVEYAILEGKSNKLHDILREIRKIEEVMPPPTWGERRYKKVYQYVRLLRHKKAFEQALNTMEKKFKY